jgi:DNA-binding MarR family transcriptional regulator
MTELAAGGHPGAVTGRRRAPRAVGKGAERARGAKVDLACLTRLLGYNLRRAYQMSWRVYVSTIGENKLRPGLYSMLMLVRANPGIAQIELGTHLGVDKASVVALLDRLEHSGFIERRRSTRDRRRQGIFLTSVGAAELESLTVQVRQVEKQMNARFSRAEYEQLLELLQRLYA